MLPRIPITLIGMLLLAGTCLQGASLVSESPFIPEGWLEAQKRREDARQRPAAPAPQAPSIALERLLEFRGAFKLGNKWRFNIVNKKDNKSEWHGLNEENKDILVRSYDDKSKSIKVTYDGRTETLTLASANTLVQQVATAANVVNPSTAVPADAEQRIRNANVSEDKKQEMLSQLRATRAKNAAQANNVVTSTNPTPNNNATSSINPINVVAGSGGNNDIPTPVLTIGGANGSVSTTTTTDGTTNNTSPAARVQRRRIIKTDNTTNAPPPLP